MIERPSFKPRREVPQGNWLHLVPGPLRPFARLMRLDRPIGTWLLLLPCWWSVTLASYGVPDLAMLGLFLAGALLMRGAGCTYNDIIDRDIDAKVARTAARPLPSGQVSVRAAWIFLALQLLAALGVLLQLNRTAQIVGASALVLVAAYPFMKRITYWPQAWLGLTFNWGALLGWAAAMGEIERPAVLLYIGGFFWTLGYDTIYAHQDRDDDALIGVKSSALALGKHTRMAVAAFYAVAIVAFTMAILPPLIGWPTVAALGVAALHLAWQAATLNIDDPANCLHRFRSNRDFGLIILVAIALTRF